MPRNGGTVKPASPSNDLTDVAEWGVRPEMRAMYMSRAHGGSPNLWAYDTRLQAQTTAKKRCSLQASAMPTLVGVRLLSRSWRAYRTTSAGVVHPFTGALIGCKIRDFPALVIPHPQIQLKVHHRFIVVRNGTGGAGPESRPSASGVSLSGDGDILRTTEVRDRVIIPGSAQDAEPAVPIRSWLSP